MILYNLKKKNDPKLWECYKVGYATDCSGTILNVGDIFHRKMKIRNRNTLNDEEWRSLTLAYLRTSIEMHPGGPYPQYGFPDRTIISYPQALELVRDNTDLGQEIIRRNREHVDQLIEDLSKELGESCEVAAP